MERIGTLLFIAALWLVVKITGLFNDDGNPNMPRYKNPPPPPPKRIFSPSQYHTMSDIKSLGSIRVREDFNPNTNLDVAKIKRLTAQLIDLCEKFKEKDARLASIAQTTYEEAAMWAVKAATA
jgi:hypothetical protein